MQIVKEEEFSSIHRYSKQASLYEQLAEVENGVVIRLDGGDDVDDDIQAVRARLITAMLRRGRKVKTRTTETSLYVKFIA